MLYSYNVQWWTIWTSQHHNFTKYTRLCQAVMLWAYGCLSPEKAVKSGHYRHTLARLACPIQTKSVGRIPFVILIHAHTCTSLHITLLYIWWDQKYCLESTNIYIFTKNCHGLLAKLSLLTFIWCRLSRKSKHSLSIASMILADIAKLFASECTLTD